MALKDRATTPVWQGAEKLFQEKVETWRSVATSAYYARIHLVKYFEYRYFIGAAMSTHFRCAPGFPGSSTTLGTFSYILVCIRQH
jgi:hypothetical protein